MLIHVTDLSGNPADGTVGAFNSAAGYMAVLDGGPVIDIARYGGNTVMA